MKIYTINHQYTNGMTYEDYREYEDILYYSTLDKAYSIFWEKVTSDYEGIYYIKEITLDTQEVNIIEESAYIEESYPYNDEPYNDFDDCYWDCEYSEDPWEVYYLNESDELNEEWDIIDEWLTHEGENYKIFEEINAIRLDNLLKDLEELTSCKS